MSDYLSEAFKAMNVLEEDTFNITDEDDIESLKKFVADDIDVEEDDFAEIIDTDARNEDELQNSYVGKVILKCQVCPDCLIYKDPADVILNDAGDLANEGEECPVCGSTEGFKVVGQVEEFGAEDDDKEVEDDDDFDMHDFDDIDDEDDDKDDDKKDDKKEEGLKEDFQKVNIETDTETMTMESHEDGGVTVTTSPKKDEEDLGNEVIAPVEADVESEIENNKLADDEDESGEIDIDIDEFSEDDFDELGESYLKKVYENVDSYKTTKGSLNGNKIQLEGVITFKSGKKAKTAFVFESHRTTKKGKHKFLGENQSISPNKKAFVITGDIKDKKLCVESFTYSYSAKGNDGKSKRLYGTVSKKSK